MKHNILIIAYLFPPLSGIGHVRPLRFANYWVANQLNVNVCCGHPKDKEYFNYIDVDNNTLRSISSGIKISRISNSHPLEYLKKLIRSIKKRDKINIEISSLAGTVENNNKSQGLNLLGRVKRLLTDYLYKPDPFWGWCAKVFFKVISTKIYRNADVIYTTGYPWTPLIVSVLLGKFLKKPVVLDYRDPWHANPYEQLETDFTYRIENWVIKNSDLVITNTKSMKLLYQQKFPASKEKIHTVVNGIDQKLIDLFSTLEKEVENVKKHSNKYVEITHVGTVYEERMPFELINLLKELVLFTKDMGVDLTFRFVGKFLNPRHIIDTFSKYNIQNHLEIAGSVDSFEAKRIQLRSDYLLLLQSNTNIQVPAKIFEYVLAKKPIISISNSESETARLIMTYNLGINISDLDDWAHAKELFENFLRINRPFSMNFPAFLKDFNSDRLSAQLTERIYNII